MNTGPAPIGDDDLQAFVDDRLDNARQAVVVAYLEAHPEIAQHIAAQRQQRQILRDQLQAKFAEPIPARLRLANLAAAGRQRRLGRLKMIAAAMVLFFAGAGSGWLAQGIYGAGEGLVLPPPLLVAQDAALAHRTFVVEVAHPVEVAAANEAHLMQWLSKRVGLRLTAPDLQAFGYRLVGGRLLPGSVGAAAQLMYDHADGNRLTLYVQASTGDETAFRYSQLAEAATFVWIDRGFGFAVTAQAPREALLPIAERVYQHFGDVGVEAARTQNG